MAEFDLSLLTEEEAQLMVVSYKGEGEGMTLVTYIQGVEMMYTFKKCEEAGCLCAVMPAIAIPEGDKFSVVKPFVEEECTACEETEKECCKEGEAAESCCGTSA